MRKRKTIGYFFGGFGGLEGEESSYFLNFGFFRALSMTFWQSSNSPPILTPFTSHMWLLMQRSIVRAASPDLPVAHTCAAAENVRSTLAELAGQARKSRAKDPKTGKSLQ